MKKTIFSSIAFMAFYLTGSAQGVRFGVTGGVAVANYTVSLSGVTASASSKTGVYTGFLADIPPGSLFSFQPAINYLQKGTKISQTMDAVTYGSQFTVNTIEVPLNFLYNAKGGSGSFFIGAGPSLGYGLSGQYGTIDNGNTDFQKIKFGNGEDDDIKRLDFGANFITGYTLKNGIMLALNYNLGLNNLLPQVADNGSLKSRYVGIRLGYLFGGKQGNSY